MGRCSRLAMTSSSKRNAKGFLPNLEKAYRNFVRQAMGRKEVVYDFMSYLSTLSVRAIQRVPYFVSFIGQGVIAGESGIKTLEMNGKAPGEPDYPYHPVFSFAVEGTPTGLAGKFVDFTFSEEGQAIIRKKKMTPILLSPRQSSSREATRGKRAGRPPEENPGGSWAYSETCEPKRAREGGCRKGCSSL